MRSPRTRTEKAAVVVIAAATASALFACLLWEPASVATGEPEAAAHAAHAQPVVHPAAGGRVVRTAAEQRDGYYTAPVGTELTYALQGRCEYSVEQAEAGRQATGFHVHSGFTVVVADRRHDEILVEVRLSNVALASLTPGSAATDPVSGAAAEPFLVRLGTDGSVRGYRFAEGLDGEQRNFMRGLFSAYAHRVPTGAQGTWESTDHDSAGELVARFTLQATGGDAVHVERRKLRYEVMAGNELHPHVLAGRSVATLSRTLGWIEAVDVDERMTLKLVALGVEVDVRATFGFELQTRTTTTPAIPASVWDEPWHPAAGHRENCDGGDADHDRDRWARRLQGENLASLTRALAALLAVEPQDTEAIDAAWQAIIWLVKLRPETAAEVRLMVGAGLDTRLGNMLLSALGAAGTDPAQDVLTAMRADPGLPEAVRRSATMAMFQLARPNERLLSAVAGDIADAPELSGDRALAMLLLGALAPRAGDAPVGGRTAIATLLAFEARARQEGRLDLWLDALGNVGTDAVVPHAQRLTRHEQDSVRGAAYHALRRVVTPQAVALLREGLADPAPSVRLDVITALGEHRSPAAVDALIRAARDDIDPAVRRAGQRALAPFAKPASPARHALAELAETDPDPDTRKAARELLRALR